jgi:ABC-type glycerol-3-phosphate transport system substrate-binding protein
MAGQAADLFTLSGLPYGVFAAKGLLEDVAALMAPDRGFDKSLYLENIINAPAFRGKIYSVIPSFSLMTIAGKSENVGTGYPGLGRSCRL